jgi:hypothetical protein
MATVPSEKKRLGVEGGSDQWVPLSAREREKGEYRFGEESRWAAGRLLKLGRNVSPGSNYIFFFFSSFPFLLS